MIIEQCLYYSTLEVSQTAAAFFLAGAGSSPIWSDEVQVQYSFSGSKNFIDSGLRPQLLVAKIEPELLSHLIDYFFEEFSDFAQRFASRSVDADALIRYAIVKPKID